MLGGSLRTARGSNFNGEVVYDSTARDTCMQDAASLRSTADTLWGLEDEYGCLDPVNPVDGGIVLDTSVKDPSINEPLTVFCVAASSLVRAANIVIKNANGRRGSTQNTQKTHRDIKKRAPPPSRFVHGYILENPSRFLFLFFYLFLVVPKKAPHLHLGCTPLSSRQTI